MSLGLKLGQLQQFPLKFSNLPLHSLQSFIAFLQSTYFFFAACHSFSQSHYHLPELCLSLRRFIAPLRPLLPLRPIGLDVEGAKLFQLEEEVIGAGSPEMRRVALPPLLARRHQLAVPRKVLTRVRHRLLVLLARLEELLLQETIVSRRVRRISRSEKTTVTDTGQRGVLHRRGFHSFIERLPDVELGLRGIEMLLVLTPPLAIGRAAVPRTIAVDAAHERVAVDLVVVHGNSVI